ncbi:response regulator [Sinimarinibacterium sp. CAU 1509]|uniref:response regulator n=1 Tax=Sinimarinibacterium sp. CAU 1509 TaxID=2562283 RepID=UPI0010AB79EC|nr:response regulator [Sinimarinibacterium sp. CAU 1509]TJY62857.1 response regulator [Sinimarinibacterium sp. CAU 1509]
MTKLKTLLVDDNRPFLVLARHLLSECPEIEVIGEAADGFQAVESAARLKPDLIIMDLAMPGMGGLQATRLIKAQDDPPIIIIASHYDDPAHREFVAQVGAEGFVNKQQYETEVIEFVQRLIREQSNV